MQESIRLGNQIETKDNPLFDFKIEAKKFLGDYYDYFEKFEDLRNIYEEAVTEFRNQKFSSVIKYDKYSGNFKYNGKKVSKGEIIASRHFGFSFDIKNIGTSQEEKTILKNYNYLNPRDIYLNMINQKLATFLYEENKNKDSQKAEDYKATLERISKNLNTEEEQLGFFAEQIMIANFERISIDRNDLSLDIFPANAFQDVNDKIDFIISSKNKSRGVGTTIGIQFTINEKAKEHKEEQITKAKKRNAEVDNILLITMDQKSTLEAKNKWIEKGKDISGPWKHLPPEIRKDIIQNVLGSLVGSEVLIALANKEI